MLSDAELDRARRRFRRGGAARARRRFPLRRREGVPRLPRARAARRAHAAARTAARSRIARGFCAASIEAIRAHVSGLDIAVRMSVFDTVPYRKRPADQVWRAGVASRERRGLRLPGSVSCPATSSSMRRSTDARAVSANAGAARRPMDLHDRRQPVLQPRTCSGRRSFRRSTATSRRRSAARRVAADSRRRPSSSASSRSWCSSDPPTAICRSGCRTSAQRQRARRLCDFVGLGRIALSYPDLPADVLSGAPLKRACVLPHVQRLHDRPAHGPGVRLLSARPVLHRAARSRAQFATCARTRGGG